VAVSAWHTVAKFRDAWDTGDLDRVCELVTGDVFYHNMPRPSMQGKDVFRAYMDAYEARLGRFLYIRWEILNMAENGTIVFLERISHLAFANGHKIDCPITGVFEVRDGKIASWKDYFDKSQFDT
jgi:limonene-1,2-epoxide hydrolase